MMTELPPSQRLIDLRGKRFGRLLVTDYNKKIGRQHAWDCICDCGNKWTALGCNLRAGRTLSCGCYCRERISESHKTHGMAGTRVYKIWLGMHERCKKEYCTSYDRYGARGISVAERWSSFENFYEDMGPVPSGHSLDRIDNNKDYEPGNCRWATAKMQARNTRRNRRLDLHGKKMTAVEAAEITGISQFTLYKRMDRGLTGEKLFSKRRLNQPRVKLKVAT